MDHDGVSGKNKRSIKQILSDNPLYGLGAVVAALTLPASLYLGFDLAKSELAPCESIYRQSSVGLATKISFLQAEGELQIGRRKLDELDDRTKAVALNLKTCCTVLEAGKLDPEQFLQCKSKGRDYDARIDALVALVKTAVGKVNDVTQAKLATAKADPIVTAVVAPRKTNPQAVHKAIAKTVDEAEAVSKNLNKQVKQVRAAQAVAQLKAIPPKNVKIEAQEREPNNDKLNTNEIELGKWVTGAVAQKGDWDFFTFKTPPSHRDWMTVEVQNRSNSLRPRLDLYNANKTHVTERANETHGGDVKYSFVTAPGKKYLLAVSGKWGQTTGVYLLKVSANKSYDKFEPNQDILNAKKVSLGTPIEAAIMDGGDWDYYVFKGSKKKQKLSVFLENRSKNLRPIIHAYNSSKTHFRQVQNETRGGDIEYVLEVPPGRRFFLAVGARWSKSAGTYTLEVNKE